MYQQFWTKDMTNGNFYCRGKNIFMLMTSLETSILNNFSANRFIVERHRSNAHKFSIPDVIDKR